MMLACVEILTLLPGWLAFEPWGNVVSTFLLTVGRFAGNGYLYCREYSYFFYVGTRNPNSVTHTASALSTDGQLPDSFPILNMKSALLFLLKYLQSHVYKVSIGKQPTT